MKSFIVLSCVVLMTSLVCARTTSYPKNGDPGFNTNKEKVWTIDQIVPLVAGTSLSHVTDFESEKESQRTNQASISIQMSVTGVSLISPNAWCTEEKCKKICDAIKYPHSKCLNDNCCECSL